MQLDDYLYFMAMMCAQLSKAHKNNMTDLYCCEHAARSGSAVTFLTKSDILRLKLQK